MITPGLIQFIKSELANGGNRDSIAKLLKTQNWTDEDIAEGFSAIPQMPTQVLPNGGVVTSLPVRSHRKSVLISIFIIIIILIGGAFGYVSGYFVPFDKIFSQAFSSSTNTTSVTFNSHILIDASGLKTTDSPSQLLKGLSNTFEFDVNGSSDVSDSKNTNSVFSFSASSGTIELAADFRIVGGLLYINFTKTPDIGFISLKPIEDKWIAIPSSTNNLTIPSVNPLFSQAGLDPNSLNKLTDIQKKYIVDLTKKAHFIKITGKHLPEIIDGTVAFHFNFDLDRDGIISYLKDLISYLRTVDPNYTKDIPDITDADYIKSSNALKTFTGEAWIGVFDHRLHKIQINASVLNPDKPDDGLVKIMATLAYSDWNKPVSVKAPQNSITIEQLMSSIFNDSTTRTGNTSVINNDALSGDSSLKEIDASIKSIESNLRGQAELFYSSNNSSYKGFCTSRAKNGAYVLAIKLPNNTVYKCNDSSQKWASWSKMSTNQYFCVDSTGIAKAIDGVPSGTSC